MISAMNAEAHRFGRVRKNGYDPAEVDAVVARLADALRQYDERIALLTDKIDAADASADAIRNTFVAAQTTRDEILRDAQVAADQMAEEARDRAEELSRGVRSMHSEIASTREAILTKVCQEADERMLAIERKTAQRSANAEWAVKEALEVRNRAVSDAEADAEVIRHEAESEAERIRERVASMSEAAVALEKAAETLAHSALEGARAIDLRAVEQLDETDPDRSASDADISVDASEPEIVIEDKHPMAVSEQVESALSHPEAASTQYQRSTGIPLRERIKIARMSG